MNDRKEGLAWDDLRFFLALARAGSLMAAARTLGVEHSTVSRRIGSLEGSLGLRLFDRLPRGWRPTPEGVRLITQAENVEREVAMLRHSAAEIDALAGEVRITAPPVLLTMVVVPGLGEMMRTYPGLVPVLIGARRTSDLGRAEADIALRLGSVEGPDLVTRRIAHVTYGLYGRPEHVSRAPGRRIYIGLDKGQSDVPQTRWLEARRRSEGSRIGMRSNDMTAQIGAARAGLGLALLPRFAVRSAPELRELEEGEPFEARPLNLVMHSDIRRAARVRMVADYLGTTVRGALRQFS